VCEFRALRELHHRIKRPGTVACCESYAPPIVWNDLANSVTSSEVVAGHEIVRTRLCVPNQPEDFVNMRVASVRRTGVFVPGLFHWSIQVPRRSNFVASRFGQTPPKWSWLGLYERSPTRRLRQASGPTPCNVGAPLVTRGTTSTFRGWRCTAFECMAGPSACCFAVWSRPLIIRHDLNPAAAVASHEVLRRMCVTPLAAFRTAVSVLAGKWRTAEGCRVGELCQQTNSRVARAWVGAPPRT
jgi:hypothetical protein